MTEQTSSTEKAVPVKENCPKCNGERTCDVHGHIYVPWRWEDRQGNSVNGGAAHSLLQCRGCETVFYLDDSWNDQDVDHWYDYNGETQGEEVRTKVTYPRPDDRAKPVWFDAIGTVDLQLQRILNETYVAYNHQAYILTAVGLRTVLDRGTEVLKIEPAKTFAEKLKELQAGGWIGSTEHDILTVVTDAGNAAAHRGWSPDASETTQLLDAMEVFLQRAFIVGQKALSIKASIPPKPKRKKIRTSEQSPK